MKYPTRMWKAYAEAVISPLLATIVAFGLEPWLPRGNLSLLYLTAVLIVAVRTSTKPALACAITSFLIYNFFFTEPHLTLVIMHREDALTVSFFLLMAALTGHLAARLREQVTALRAREAINQAQFLLSEKLSVSIEKHEIYEALCDALKKVISEKCLILDIEDNHEKQYLLPLAGDTDIQQPLTEVALETLFSKKAVDVFFENKHYYFTQICKKAGTTTLLGLTFQNNISTKAEEGKIIVNTFAQQACLALGRTQLVTELQSERLEKERELLRSALLSSISHDLRTPLAAMIGSTTSLIDLDTALNNIQKRELLDAILQEAQRLDRYIQNLLDMTRLGYDGLRLERDWVGFGEIINVTLKRIKSLLKGHKIHSYIDQNLPSLYVHAALIEQAIFNVLENAVKFSPDNTEIYIEACIKSKNLQIDITDQGPGISDVQKSKIFNMFFSSPQGDRHAAGTGLGLAICQGVIHAHGGKIDALTGHNNIGLTIRLSLPILNEESKQFSDDV